MAYRPNIFFDEFKRRIERRFTKPESLEDYQKHVAGIASRARKYFFSKETTKTMQSKRLCHNWIHGIRSGVLGSKQEFLKDDPWAIIQNFNENTIGDMRDALSRPIHSFAFHYRLHRYHRPEDLELADKLDIAWIGEPIRFSGQPAFRYIPDPEVYRRPNAPMSPPPHLTEEAVINRLNKNIDDGVWLSPHNHHSIRLQPRPEVEERLKAFMESEKRFSVCPLIGPSGAGKTRLISEWMIPYILTDDQKEWEAGFVTSEQKDARNPRPWEAWEIARNTLIIIDYTYAFDEVMRAIVQKATYSELGNDHLVRVLVLDHQMPEFLKADFLWGQIRGGRPSELLHFEECNLEHKIELKAEDDNSELLRNIITQAANIADHRIKPSDPIVDHALENLDRMGHAQGNSDATRHPLFAALLGQAIRKSGGAQTDFSKWSRRDLIEQYFEGPDRLPWSGWDNKTEPTKIQNGLTVGALVSAATLKGGLSFDDIQLALPKCPPSLLQKANRITNNRNQFAVRPFLPDILGEIFVLKFLQRANCNNMTFTYFISFLQPASENNKFLGALKLKDNLSRIIRNLISDAPQYPELIEYIYNILQIVKPENFSINKNYRFVQFFLAIDVIPLLKKLNDSNDGICYNHLCLTSIVEEFQISSFSISNLMDACENIPGNFPSIIAFKAIAGHLEQLKSDEQLQIRQLIIQIIPFLVDKYGLGDDLCIAAKHGYTSIMDILLHCLKYDVNKQSHDGSTALMYASMFGRLETVRYLIDQGANINVQDSDGNNALMHASINGEFDVVELLQQEGARMNCGDADGVTALMIASMNGSISIVEFLVNHIDDIDARDEFGRTALLYACTSGSVDIVRCLMDKGADPSIIDKWQKDAFSIASSYGHHDVIVFMESRC